MATSQDHDVGSRNEFKTYHIVPKKDGHLKVEKIPDPFGKTDGRSRNGDINYALVIRRNFTNENLAVPESVILGVNSPHLLKAFRDVIQSYPTVASNFTGPFELKSPFQMLVHCWDDLEQYRQKTEDAVMRTHMNMLFQFMEYELGPERERMMTMLQKRQVTYRTAWVIYRPGVLLYRQILNHPWLLRCVKTAYEENTTRGPYLEVHCTFTDHNGKQVGEAKQKLVIYQKQHFGSDNPAVITNLPIFPRSFLDGQDNLEERLEKRGRKFLDHMPCSVEAYDGLAQFLKEPPWDYWHPEMEEFGSVWLPYTETGRIVLDRRTFQEDQYCNDFELDISPQAQPLLCPPFLNGYSLSRKEWCHFFVDNISGVQWKENVWDSLILGDEQKLVLQALVASHRYPENPRDQPAQKGKGLVILLHGTPGSGKTLTAETAAEATHKALISTSLGELNRNNNPWVFEMNLRRTLKYATLWKAVVLLDEADVFLEARGDNDKRNSLVAVFLKELEYFSGIVFLTTNRLASFDLAMKSRIHMALGYTPPNDAIRRSIWAQCLQGVPAEESELSDLEEAIDTLIHKTLNGREITNAVFTARTIARFQGEKLQLQHIQKVLKVRADFDKNLKSEERKIRSWSASEMNSTRLLRRNSILTEEPDEF